LRLQRRSTRGEVALTKATAADYEKPRRGEAHGGIRRGNLAKPQVHGKLREACVKP
jgi:hypothetical protein